MRCWLAADAAAVIDYGHGRTGLPVLALLVVEDMGLGAAAAEAALGLRRRQGRRSHIQQLQSLSRNLSQKLRLVVLASRLRNHRLLFL